MAVAQVDRALDMALDDVIKSKPRKGGGKGKKQEEGKQQRGKGGGKAKKGGKGGNVKVVAGLKKQKFGVKIVQKKGAGKANKQVLQTKKKPTATKVPNGEKAKKGKFRTEDKLSMTLEDVVQQGKAKEGRKGGKAGGKVPSIKTGKKGGGKNWEVEQVPKRGRKGKSVKLKTGGFGQKVQQATWAKQAKATGKAGQKGGKAKAGKGVRGVRQTAWQKKGSKGGGKNNWWPEESKAKGWGKETMWQAPPRRKAAGKGRAWASEWESNDGMSYKGGRGLRAESAWGQGWGKAGKGGDSWGKAGKGHHDEPWEDEREWKQPQRQPRREMAPEPVDRNRYYREQREVAQAPREREREPMREREREREAPTRERRGDERGERAARGTKIKVENIPRGLTWRDIKEAFEDTGEVLSCTVENGMARITYKNALDARKAEQTFDRGELNGQAIYVSIEG